MYGDCSQFTSLTTQILYERHSEHHKKGDRKIVRDRGKEYLLQNNVLF